MVFKLFRKSKNDDFIKPPIRVEPSNEKMVFESNGPAEMPIEDVFLIKGRGTAVTGQITLGSFHVGQKVTINTPDGPIDTTIDGVEMLHKRVDFATAGANVGLIIGDVDRNAITRGSTVTAE